MTTDTDLIVCNRALQIIGAEPMTAFTDSTVEATVCNSLYESIVRDCLASSRWRFATKRETAFRIGTVSDSEYAASYSLPSDYIMISSVEVAGSSIEYDIYEDTFYCDAGPGDTVVIEYLYRVLEKNCPPYFTLAVVFKLASILALPIARDIELENALDKRQDRLMRQARTKDSQQQTTRKLNVSRFVTQRRG